MTRREISIDEKLLSTLASDSSQQVDTQNPEIIEFIHYLTS